MTNTTIKTNELRLHELHSRANRSSMFLKAMANNKRVLILQRLLQGEASVAELRETIPTSQSSLSQHLSILLNGKLVCSRRMAQSAFYSLTKEGENIVAATLNATLGEQGGFPKQPQQDAKIGRHAPKIIIPIPASTKNEYQYRYQYQYQYQ